jgi:hypothetical protein
MALAMENDGKRLGRWRAMSLKVPQLVEKNADLDMKYH